jgi:hypothetical protein
VTPGPGDRKCTRYLAAGPGGTPLALPLSEGLGRTAQTPGRPRTTENLRSLFFLLLRSEVRAKLHAVRPVIAAAAVLHGAADC